MTAQELLWYADPPFVRSFAMANAQESRTLSPGIRRELECRETDCYREHCYTVADATRNV